MKATERFILYMAAIIAGVTLSALLTGCGDRTFTINVAGPEATATVPPLPFPVPEPARPATPDPLPDPVDTLGPPPANEPPFNEDDETVDTPTPTCDPLGNGRGEGNGTPGNGKGRGDEKGCER